MVETGAVGSEAGVVCVMKLLDVVPGRPGGIARERPDTRSGTGVGPLVRKASR
jgi:hypothetical protein